MIAKELRQIADALNAKNDSSKLAVAQQHYLHAVAAAENATKENGLYNTTYTVHEDCGTFLKEMLEKDGFVVDYSRNVNGDFVEIIHNIRW